MDILRWLRAAVAPPVTVGYPLIAIALLAFSSLIVSPLVEERGSIHLGDGGKVGEIDTADRYEDASYPFPKVVYRWGDRLCHQRPERSLFLNDNQMPVCSRDLGIAAGMFLGFFIGACLRKRVSWLVVAALLMPMAVDGGLQAFTVYESISPVRLSTGLIGGAALGAWINRSVVEVIGHVLERRRDG